MGQVTEEKVKNDKPQFYEFDYHEIGVKAIRLVTGEDLVCNVVELTSAKSEHEYCVLYDILQLFFNMQTSQFAALPYLPHAEYEYLSVKRSDILIITGVNEEILKEHKKRFSMISQPNNGNIVVPNLNQ